MSIYVATIALAFVSSSSIQCVCLLTKPYSNILHSVICLAQHYELNSWTNPVASITTVPSVSKNIIQNTYTHTQLSILLNYIRL